MSCFGMWSDVLRSVQAGCDSTSGVRADRCRKEFYSFLRIDRMATVLAHSLFQDHPCSIDVLL